MCHDFSYSTDGEGEGVHVFLGLPSTKIKGPFELKYYYPKGFLCFRERVVVDTRYIVVQ